MGTDMSASESVEQPDGAKLTRARSSARLWLGFIALIAGVTMTGQYVSAQVDALATVVDMTSQRTILGVGSLLLIVGTGCLLAEFVALPRSERS